MEVGSKMLLLLPALLAATASATTDCSEFPFGSESYWYNVRPYLLDPVAADLSSPDSLYTVSLRFRYQYDRTDNRTAEAYLAKNIPELETCWAERPRKAKAMLVNSTGHVASRKCQECGSVAEALEFEFDNVARCGKYTAILFIDGRKVISRNNVVTGLGPSHDTPPLAEVQSSATGANVKVTPPYACSAKRFFLRCPDTGVSISETAFSARPRSLYLDGLMPSTTVNCTVAILYDDDRLSVGRDVQLTTGQPKLSVNRATETSLRPLLESAVMKDHRLAFNVSYRDLNATTGGRFVLDASSSKEVLNRSSEVGLNGLDPFTTYELCVAVSVVPDLCADPAYCVRLPRPLSNVCSTDTTLAEKPAKLPAPAVDALNGTSASVTWNIPSAQCRRGWKECYLHTTLVPACRTCYCGSTYRKSNCTQGGEEDVAISVQEESFPGLTPFANYSARGKMENDRGMSPEDGDLITFFTPAAVTLQRKEVRVSASARSILVKVARPCPYSGPVTLSYTVDSTTKLVHNYDLDSDEDANFVGEVILDGLRPATNYTVCVEVRSLPTADGFGDCHEGCEATFCFEKTTLDDGSSSSDGHSAVVAVLSIALLLTAAIALIQNVTFVAWWTHRDKDDKRPARVDKAEVQDVCEGFLKSKLQEQEQQDDYENI